MSFMWIQVLRVHIYIYKTKKSGLHHRRERCNDGGVKGSPIGANNRFMQVELPGGRQWDFPWD
jgi:hypothetical protein